MANTLATNLQQSTKDNIHIVGFDGNGNAKKIPSDEFNIPEPPEPVIIFTVADGSAPAYGTIRIPSNKADNFRFYEFYVGHFNYRMTNKVNKGFKTVSRVSLREIARLGGSFAVQGHNNHESIMSVPVFQQGQLRSIHCSTGTARTFRIVGIK